MDKTSIDAAQQPQPESESDDEQMPELEEIPATNQSTSETPTRTTAIPLPYNADFDHEIYIDPAAFPKRLTLPQMMEQHILRAQQQKSSPNQTG